MDKIFVKALVFTGMMVVLYFLTYYTLYFGVKLIMGGVTY